MLSSRRFRLMLLGAVSSTAFTAAHAGDFSVPSGTITGVFSSQKSNGGTQTTVTQTSARAVINWSDLSVASGDTLEFVQPNASSITLNRVVGPSGGGAIVPTHIDGTVQANGQVWVLNPAGVLVGSAGQVNVAGFLATTLGIADATFASATDAFSLTGESTASVVNQGIVTASGYAVFAGHRVENAGIVQAQLGTVALGSGRAMSMSFSADKLISFVVSDPATSQGSGVFNTATGQLIANGGRVLMTARAASAVAANVINSAGLVQANSVSLKNGEITLDAGPTGDVNVSGTLNAKGTGSGEIGGNIIVTGKNVFAAPTSQFLADGQSGGGTISLGQRPAQSGMSSPTKVYALGGSTFDASAGEVGAGGHITLQTDYNDAASFIGANGNFYANGGRTGGVGGTIEAFFSNIDLSGANAAATATGAGEAAQLKFNANSIVISTGLGAGTAIVPGTATGTGGTTTTLDVVGTLTQTTVQDLLNRGQRVSINAIGEGDGTGNILIAAPIAKSSDQDASLNFSASNNIDLVSGAIISAAGGSLNLSFLSDHNGDGLGLTRLGANISLLSGSALNDGLNGVKYDGYYADNYTFFANATPQPDPRFALPFTAINTTTPGVNFDDTYSVKFFGYFKPQTTGAYTFSTTSDDASQLFLGNSGQSVNALQSDVFAANPVTPLVSNGGIHPAAAQIGTTSQSLIAGQYYPILVLFGENGFSDEITVKFGQSGQTLTDNGLGSYYHTPNGEIVRRSNLSFSGDVVLNSNVSLATQGDVLFDGTVNSATGSAFNLNVDAGSGALSFDGDVGTGSALAGLTAKSGTFLAAKITGNNSAELMVDTAGEAAVSGIVTGAKLTKAGTGTLSLSSDANVTNISIDAGRLRSLSASGTALQSANSILIGTGGVLDLTSPQTANVTSIKSLSGAGRVDLAAGKTLDIVSGLATDSFAGVFLGPTSSTVKVSGGSLALTGDTGFTGLFKVDGATLKLVGAGSIASASGLEVGGRDGAVIDLSGLTLPSAPALLTSPSGATVMAGSAGVPDTTSLSGATVTPGSAGIPGTTVPQGANGVIASLGATEVGRSSSTTIRNFFTDTTTRLGSVLLGGTTLVIETDANAVGANALSFSGTGSLEKTGPGTLQLRGANSYSGNTRVSQGVLDVPTEVQLGTGDITLAGGTLRFTSDGQVSLTKAVTLVADSAIEFTPPSPGFQVNWSGAQFNNSASAIGLFEFDPSLFASMNGEQSTKQVGAGFAINSVTVQGAASGNGTFGPTDFSSYYFSAANPLDTTRELIGQPMSNGFNFGSFSATGGYGGPSGDFNLFSSGNNPNAPNGTFYFVLTTAGASGSQMAVVSMVPIAVGAPSDAQISGAINGGFNLRIAANGKLSLLGTMGNSQPLGSLTVGANGTLRLGANAQITAIGDIRLKALTRFLNESTYPSVLASSSGTWRVYSGNSNPFGGGTTADVAGGLVYEFKAYGVGPQQDFNTAAANGLDGFIYAYTPSLTVTSANPITKVYDGTTALLDPLPALTITSPVSGDVLTVSGTPTGNFTSPDASTSASILLSGLTVSAVAGTRPVFGYSLGASTLAATITPKPLTVSLTGTVSRAYDGTTAVSLSQSNFNVTGLVDNQSLSLISATGNLASKDVGTGLNVTTDISQVSFQAGSDTLLYNYILPTEAFGKIGDITPKVLTASLTGTARKIYDSTTSATLAADSFVLDGLVGTESLTIVQAHGSYASKDVGSQIIVTADISPADFTAGSGTLITNYVLPSATVSGAIGEITPKALVASLVGTISRAYDGTSAATLAATNFNLSGFAGDDRLNVSQTVGRYASKDVGTQISVSALLSSSDYVAVGGTLTRNYILPTEAFGKIGDITRRALYVGILGSVSRQYDGGVAATLAGSNIAVSGLVEGELISISQAQASYSAKDVGRDITVSVRLSLDAFSAASNTSLENYALPDLASGAVGEITPRTLTYVATPAERPAKTENPTFTGTVTGFVATDNAASATTGVLTFSSDATSASAEGRYAINGAGLSATNYVFEQAGANATALTVKAALPSIAQIVSVVPVVTVVPTPKVAPAPTPATAPAPAQAAAPAPAASPEAPAPADGPGPAATGPSDDGGKPAPDKPSDAAPAAGDVGPAAPGDVPPPPPAQGPAPVDAAGPGPRTSAAAGPPEAGPLPEPSSTVTVVAVAVAPVAPLPPSPVPSKPPPTPADDVDTADPILQSVVEAPAAPPPAQRAVAIVSQLSPFVAVSVPLPVRPAGVPGIDTRYSLTGNPEGM